MKKIFFELLVRVIIFVYIISFNYEEEKMDQEKIGKFIKEKRKENGLTQENLAEKLGVSGRSVSKWENGICMPDMSLYNDICNILNISLVEFISGETKTEKIQVSECDESINSIIEASTKNNNLFRKILWIYVVISIILSFFLYSTNSNGLSLLLVSIILVVYLSKETLKRLFLSIKKNENFFIVCVNFLSIIALSLYLFWIKAISLLIISILLFILVIYIAIKKMKIESIMYIISIILLYGFIILIYCFLYLT